jgi:hypothetical protein
MSQHTSEAVHVLFNKFIAHISQRVIEEYGISYMTYDNTKNNWRYRLPYTAKTEAFLILESKVFLRMLDEDSGRTSNPGFLKPLVNQMADFLSAYTMRAGVEKRGIAIKQLKQKLWDENVFIQQILARQAEQPEKNEPRTPETIAKKRCEQKRKQALRDLETARRVHAEFVSAGYRYVKR